MIMMISILSHQMLMFAAQEMLEVRSLTVVLVAMFGCLEGVEDLVPAWRMRYMGRAPKWAPDVLHHIIAWGWAVGVGGD